MLAILTAGCAAAEGDATVPPPDPTVAPAPPALEPVRPAREGEPGLWMSWSLVRTSTGERVGSANAATGRTNSESAIKTWIAADTLRAAQDAGRPVTATERQLIRQTVRSSDDDATETLYRRLGRDAVFGHLRQTCEVSVSTNRRAYWSYAQITAVDATRIMECVLRLAPGWEGGDELVDDLRTVDDDGRSGITGLLAGKTVAEKNGWTYHSDTGWNVNCVVAWDEYVLAVLTRFPGGRSEEYGWGVCRDVARDILPMTSS